MRIRTVVIVLVVAGLLVATIDILHGRAHGLMRRWMPALHGSH